MFNPFSAKDVLIDFTLSNARRLNSSKGNPLALKDLKLNSLIFIFRFEGLNKLQFTEKDQFYLFFFFFFF